MNTRQVVWVPLCLLGVALVFWFGGGVAPAHAAPPQQASPSVDPKMADLAYKNIQVFKGLPAEQLIPAMQFMAASLGVRCDYCHVPQQFEKEDKTTKQSARRMIQMMEAINRENFAGKREVNCYTCHRGAARPVSLPVVMEASAAPPPEPKPAPATLPAVEQVFEKYAQALGGRAAAEKLTSRVAKGFLEAPGGLRAPIETAQKAPDKFVSILQTPQGTTTQGFDGTIAWVLNLQDKTLRESTGAELSRARRDAQFYGEFELRKSYKQVRVVGIEKVGDREAYLVRGVPADDSPERLYFDTQTGLLLRSLRLNESPLGATPLETNYEDYREVDGIKLPFLVRRARPDFIFTVRWQEIRHNVALDDAKFAKPPAPPAQ